MPPPFQPEKTVQRPQGTPPPPTAETRLGDSDEGEPAGAVLTADPATDPAGWGGGGDRPPVGADADGPDFPTHRSKAGTTAAVIALGTGLLGAAVMLAATRARADGDLDWSNYGVGLGATAVLLVIAVLAAVGRADVGGRAREEAITWPGVVGILATAVMIGVGINEDDKWVDYLIGGIVVGLAGVGYGMARRGAFVVVGILGLGLIYGNAVNDVLDDALSGDHAIVVAAAALTAFVVVVTGLGWLLPSRALTGVVAGVIGVVGLTGMLVGLLAARFFGMMFSGPMGAVDPAGGRAANEGFAESDVWWIVVFAAVLTVLWALAASITNHPGFSVLTIVMPTIIVPLATFALAAEKPSLWAGILAAAGGLALVGGVGLARLRGKKALLGG